MSLYTSGNQMANDIATLDILEVETAKENGVVCCTHAEEAPPMGSSGEQARGQCCPAPVEVCHLVEQGIFSLHFSASCPWVDTVPHWGCAFLSEDDEVLVRHLTTSYACSSCIACPAKKWETLPRDNVHDTLTCGHRGCLLPLNSCMGTAASPYTSARHNLDNTFICSYWKALWGEEVVGCTGNCGVLVGIKNVNNLQCSVTNKWQL